MKKFFNLKRLLKMRNKSGFTLVEVIISSALLGILIMGICMFVTPVLSMISTGQKSARATMLAETIDTYIVGCLKNAKKVGVIENSSIERMTMAGAMGTGVWADIIPFMMQSGNSDKYEVRCLGICWVDNQGLDGNQNKPRSFFGTELNIEKKLMLVHCPVDNNFTPGYNNVLKLQTDASGNAVQTKVFDDMLYNELYPVVKVDSFLACDASGTVLSTNASGYQITTDVYTDQRCYSVTSDAARDKSHLSFRGVAFAQCLNMTEPANNPIPIMPKQAAINNGRGAHQYQADGGDYFYYPSTFIYYVVPK